MPYLSASEVLIHEEALYQVYVPLPLHHIIYWARSRKSANTGYRMQTYYHAGKPFCILCNKSLLQEISLQYNSTRWYGSSARQQYIASIVQITGNRKPTPSRLPFNRATTIRRPTLLS